jgi:hypothetical protein
MEAALSDAEKQKQTHRLDGNNSRFLEFCECAKTIQNLIPNTSIFYIRYCSQDLYINDIGNCNRVFPKARVTGMLKTYLPNYLLTHSTQHSPS